MDKINNREARAVFRPPKARGRSRQKWLLKCSGSYKGLGGALPNKPKSAMHVPHHVNSVERLLPSPNKPGNNALVRGDRRASQLDNQINLGMT